MRIWFDVDTQHDFMDKNGALYVNGAEEIKPNLQKLTDYALEHDIPIFGSSDKHFGTEYFKDVEGELKKWGGPFPDHCMDETDGQLRIPETKDSLVLEFEKQTYDVFSNSQIRESLQNYEVTEAVVYGVATDYCVKAAVVGMQQRGIQCYVVADAIAGVSPDSTKKAVDEMLSWGAKFVKLKDVTKE